MHKDKDENGMLSHIHSHDAYRSRELGILEHSLLDGDMFLQVSEDLQPIDQLIEFQQLKFISGMPH